MLTCIHELFTVMLWNFQENSVNFMSKPDGDTFHDLKKEELISSPKYFKLKVKKAMRLKEAGAKKKRKDKKGSKEKKEKDKKS